MKDKKKDLSNEHGLQHFLRLAEAQVTHRLNEETSKGVVYSERINRTRLLRELIKEQLPHDDANQNSRSSARPTR